MTIKQALNEIRSKPKWYHIPNESTGKDTISTSLIQTAQKIEYGLAKPSTVRAFFDRFGYKVEFETKVTKL